MALLSDQRFRFLVALAVCGAAVLAYANIFASEFVWDDASSVQIHEDVKQGRLLELFKKDQHAFGRGEGNFYRPLVSTSFLIDYALTSPSGEVPETPGGAAKVSPFLFHVTNVAWHAVAALLLLALLARLGAPRLVQATVPVLYVLHPLHTEAVAYISGRADPMAAAFMFAGVLLAFWNESPSRRIAGAVLSGLCFVLALLCKESALIFPALLLVVAIGLRLRRPSEESPKPMKAPWLALGLSVVILGVYTALRATVLNFGSGSTPREIGLGQRSTEMLQALALYIRLIFVPTGLHMERTLHGVPVWVAGAGALLLIACIGVAVYGVRAKQARIWTGMMLFLVTWLPVSGLFPLNAPMAEHWMYVPLAGFLWAVLEMLALACKSPRSRAALVVAVYGAGVFLLSLTVARNQDWQSNESLYRATLKANPGSIRVNFNLAVTYEDLVGNLPGARRRYEKVLALYAKRKAEDSEPGAQDQYWDDELEAHLSLGRIYYGEGRYDVAARHFGQLMKVSPTDTNRVFIENALMGLAQSLIGLQEYDAARELLQQGRARFPEIEREIDGLLRVIPPGGDVPQG